LKLPRNLAFSANSFSQSDGQLDREPARSVWSSTKAASARKILIDLGLKDIRSSPINPKKVVALEGYGIRIADQVPLRIDNQATTKPYEARTISLSGCRGAGRPARLARPIYSSRTAMPRLPSAITICHSERSEGPLPLRPRLCAENLLFSPATTAALFAFPIGFANRWLCGSLAGDFGQVVSWVCRWRSILGIGLPATKYLRIFSRRLGPGPRIASRSSTLLNGRTTWHSQYLFRSPGPIPGTCGNFFDVAY